MSRVGRYIRLITKDESKRKRILELYIHHRNLYSKGSSETTFLWAIVNPQHIMITWLFLRDALPQIPVWVIIAFFPVWIIAKIVFKWCVGYWWDRKNIFDIEYNWTNKRDPIAKSLNEQVLNNQGIKGGF